MDFVVVVNCAKEIISKLDLCEGESVSLHSDSSQISQPFLVIKLPVRLSLCQRHKIIYVLNVHAVLSCPYTKP